MDFLVQKEKADLRGNLNFLLDIFNNYKYIGTIKSSGITSYLIFIWLQTICLNFIMAYPLQILVVGPFCRFIFRHLFASTNQGNESKVENEMEQHGFAE